MKFFSRITCNFLSYFHFYFKNIKKTITIGVDEWRPKRSNLPPQELSRQKGADSSHLLMLPSRFP